MSTVYAVLPGDVDDATAPCGGNVYDRRVCDALAAGQPVHEIAITGAWPQPDAQASAELGRSLDALPDGAVVLLDGLVAGGVPDVVVPHLKRLRSAVIVHLPLASETGFDPTTAANLDAAERQTLHAANIVVASSRSAARDLVCHHGLDRRRVHVVPPGVDPAPIAPGTGDGSRLLCVAAVTPRKGQDLLVRALSVVAALPWSCRLVGPIRDPAYAARVRRLISRHDLADRLRLAGPHTGDELAMAYAEADLVVLPSRAETYGMVVTEALARGTPVLATAVGGVPEACGSTPSGPPGILVPGADPGELAKWLNRWLTDGELRRRLKCSALLRRERLTTWTDTAQRVATVVTRLREAPA